MWMWGVLPTFQWRMQQYSTCTRCEDSRAEWTWITRAGCCASFFRSFPLYFCLSLSFSLSFFHSFVPLLFLSFPLFVYLFVSFKIKRQENMKLKQGQWRNRRAKVLHSVVYKSPAAFSKVYWIWFKNLIIHQNLWNSSWNTWETLFMFLHKLDLILDKYGWKAEFPP
jgi:hypothetical protein